MLARIRTFVHYFMCIPFIPHDRARVSLCNCVGTTVLGIPFKIEKIMKYPDQWSVKPTYIHYYYYIHYYITTLLHYFEFNWYTFTSFPGYMCCMSTPVDYSITSNTHYGDIVEANCYVHCDNWRIDRDEHVHSSFVHS